MSDDVPIDPCGMVVSYIKSCYTAKVRFFEGSDREDTVYWYFTSPGAKEFPWYSRFATGNYMDARVQDWPGVGEVKGTKQWRRGTNPWGMDGSCAEPIGDREWWAKGVPLSAAGPKVRGACCAMHPVVLPEGGLAGAGAAQTDWDKYYHVASGGAALGGHAPVARVYRPGGGLALGGTAPAPAARLVLPSGGLAGAAGAVVVRPVLPSGGLALGGSAPVVRPPRVFIRTSLAGYLADGVIGDNDDAYFDDDLILCQTLGKSTTIPGCGAYVIDNPTLQSLESQSATFGSPYQVMNFQSYRNGSGVEGAGQFVTAVPDGYALFSSLALGGGPFEVVGTGSSSGFQFGTFRTGSVSVPSGPWMEIGFFCCLNTITVTLGPFCTGVFLGVVGDYICGVAFAVHPSSGGTSGLPFVMSDYAWGFGATFVVLL